jgi:hypothetical protein
MSMSFAPASAHEHRLLHRMMENLRGWASNTGETYIKEPFRQGNPVKTVVGGGMTIASTVLEAPDYAIAGLLGQEVEPPASVPLGRIRRDTGKLVKDIVTLRPIRSLLDVTRLVFTDLPLDAAEAVFGFDHSGRSVRQVTRSQVASTLAA